VVASRGAATQPDPHIESHRLARGGRDLCGKTPSAPAQRQQTPAGAGREACGFLPVLEEMLGML